MAAMGISTAAQNAPLGPYCPSSLSLFRSRPRFMVPSWSPHRSLFVVAESLNRGEVHQIQSASDAISRSNFIDGSIESKHHSMETASGKYTEESNKYRNRYTQYYLDFPATRHKNSSFSARMVPKQMTPSDLSFEWKAATENVRNSKLGHGYKGHTQLETSRNGLDQTGKPFEGNGSDCSISFDGKNRHMAPMHSHTSINALSTNSAPVARIVVDKIDKGSKCLLLNNQTTSAGTLHSPSLEPKERYYEQDSVGSQIIGNKSLNATEVNPVGPQINGDESMVAKDDDTILRKAKLRSIYDKVLIVDDMSLAKKIVLKLRHEYKHLIHACDTEVAKIEVKQETPVGHGEIICFSIYSGPEADFGNGKSCIWVDVLGGGEELLVEFKEFFEDRTIKKVWHNYSFDYHVIKNYGIDVSGFHADTMHLARLWDSSRRMEGGYSLAALTGDSRVISLAKLGDEKELIGKVSMKTIFGRKKVKKDGSEGKMIVIPPVEDLQRDERELWICYSALDSISTLKLYESLKMKLHKMAWRFDGRTLPGKSMLDFYDEYWRPFGEILVKMEADGMLVDRPYLADIEKLAKAEQEVAANRFRKWASKYCPDAKYMNVGSDAQLRQLLFGGTINSKNPDECLEVEKVFKVPNVDGFIDEGRKAPLKYRNIRLHSIGVQLPVEIYTASGWPSVSGDALKVLAGKISADYDFLDDAPDLELGDDGADVCESVTNEVSGVRESSAGKNIDTSAYGAAFKAFLDEAEGREACHAIASLCEICSIDSLISNFILPLQGKNVSGNDGRVHCSLNINTETGRLSARRPNLQNQPALEKDRYKIRQAFIAKPGHSLIVADYGQLELRILAHLADCKSMLDAFKAGGDFHSRTAMNMYQHIRDAVEKKEVLLEWYPQPGEDKPPVPLLKDAFGSERRKAKMLNFSIAYGKTPVGLARDWKVSVREAKETVDLWYREREEVLKWQIKRKEEARKSGRVYTLLGRARRFPSMDAASPSQRAHIERAAINTPVQGSAADVAMCAMLRITENKQLKDMGWRLLLQVHDEVILEGPTESAEEAKAIVVQCMSKPFNGGKNILKVDLAVDAKCAQNWYAAK